MCFCIKSTKKKIAAEDNYELPEPFSFKYELGPLLGTGGFGKVFSGTKKSQGIAIVLKVLHKKSDEVPKEVVILNHLPRHDSIIGLVDHFQHKSWYIVFEKYGYLWSNSSCDLFEMIEFYNKKRKADAMKNNTSSSISNRLCLNEDQVKNIINQLLNAVEFLRFHNVLHRDIKDENILIDQNHRIKLCDFGSATLLGKSSDFGDEVNDKNDDEELNAFGGVFSAFFGTIQYASPEVIRFNAYCGYMQEVWSIGILMYTMLFGFSPFQNKEEIIHQPIRYVLDPNAPMVISRECYMILKGCLNDNMIDRLTLNNLTSADWLNYKQQPFDHASLSWDIGPNNLYNKYSVDRYRKWNIVRRIGPPFELLHCLYARKEPRVEIESMVHRITRKDTKTGFAKVS